MIHGLRLSLGIRVSSGGPGWGPHIDADVQVWKGDQHIVTIDILDRADVDADFSETEQVERYATYMARVASRMIDDAFYDMVKRHQPLTEIREIAEGMSSVSD